MFALCHSGYQRHAASLYRWTQNASPIGPFPGNYCSCSRLTLDRSTPAHFLGSTISLRIIERRKTFTKLDLSHAYQQVPLDEDSKNLVAVLDDILATGKSQEEHLNLGESWPRGQQRKAGGVRDFWISKYRNPEKSITLREISVFLYISAYFLRFPGFPEISRISTDFRRISRCIMVFCISGFLDFTWISTMSVWDFFLVVNPSVSVELCVGVYREHNAVHTCVYMCMCILYRCVVCLCVCSC